MENYIVSARKYRPLTFDSVVGQRALTTTLKNAIASGKLAHAYLFCGPRGVGKTTCARIFARTINCLTPTETGEACGNCESCKAFEQQRSFNIHELDAASNNSVEDIRSLIEQVRMPPQVGRYKVFIIDEVHMLSTAAFNAFLKTLEEPPAHAIFILATTEKHKILPTILSRCQIYDFNRMEVADIVGHLKHVAQQEGYDYEEEALSVIARKADGGMRDALSIFDQVAGYSEGHLTYRKVIEDLNVLDYDYYFKIVDQMLGKNIPAVMLTLNEILSKGFAANHFISGFASHLRDLLVSRDAQTLPLLEVSETVRTRYSEQAAKCRPQFLYRALRICNDCDLNYRTSSNKRLLVELTLIQVAQAVDDDEAGCGLGPTKILKPLFAAIAPAAAAPQAPKAQPAATTQQRPAATPAATTAPSATLPVANTQNTAAAQHHVRPVSLSISATKMQQRRKQANSANLDQARRIVINEVQPFEWKDLSYQWYRFAMELPQEQNAIAGRMKNMRPQLMDNFVVEVPVENDQVLMLMNSIRDDLVCYLRMGLHNGKVDVRFRIIQAEEAKKRAYTRQEQLAAMLEKSPGLAVLKNTLNLELA
ncbi:MAG: DNA polymerase III subunit gamma/tau [Bacteroidales bacterium]|nr:DNA polymerase III subunit gamma/tau [Bacteroidales bacterium]MDD7233618.1 DNA polymerase III subunit gamma/tau [Bacteroidales bacterium]MDY2705080.1 DNA polymerase III subunit gamma/tau [Alloprevotella sp.]